MKTSLRSYTVKLTGTLVLLAALVISGLSGCTGVSGFTDLPSLLKMVPADYDQVQYVNIDSLRNDKDLYRYYLNFKERLDAITEDMGIIAADVRHFGMAIDERLKVFYIQGEFAADTTGATLETNGFQKETWQKYELWTGDRYTVVIHDSMIIFSDLANAVKDSLDTMDSPVESLYYAGFEDIAGKVPDDLYAIAATGEEAHYDGTVGVCLGLTKVDDVTAGVLYHVLCENESYAKDTMAQIESTIGSVLFIENFTVEQNGSYAICRFEAPNETLFDFDF